MQSFACLPRLYFHGRYKEVVWSLFWRRLPKFESGKAIIEVLNVKKQLCLRNESKGKESTRLMNGGIQFSARLIL